MLSCNFQAPRSSYKIEISENLDLSDLSQFGNRFAVVGDESVIKAFKTSISDALKVFECEVFFFSFVPGDENKTRSTKEQLENEMFEKGLGRDTCVIALGGGVSTDMASFVAATYCRGVNLIVIPTTLLGMVDASVGGKCGVNVPYGKNLIGAIYPPSKVCMHLSFLKKLPLKELKNGAVEMIKHGLIASHDHFTDLESHSKELLECDSIALKRMVYDSVSIKIGIVEKDVHESGMRKLLNYGHTIGHALETLSHYSISHGEAIAIGILTESYLSMQLGVLEETVFDRIHDIFKKFDLPLWLPQLFSYDAIFDAMKMDKKAVMGNPRFTLLQDIGKPLDSNGAYCESVPEDLLKSSIQWMLDDLCCY